MYQSLACASLIKLIVTIVIAHAMPANRHAVITGHTHTSILIIVSKLQKWHTENYMYYLKGQICMVLTKQQLAIINTQTDLPCKEYFQSHVARS